MTAVLLQSNKTGLTGWISLRRGNYLKVLGIEDGDELLASFKPLGIKLFIAENGLFPLPLGAEHVQLEHAKAGSRENGGGVNVDLVRIA